MTNDTSTLNGALQELGETMADNLTTMGVPSTYDEGLTTLAGKILSIAPVSRTLTLTGNQSILSYADGDSCTLSATLTNGGSPVSGETVEFFNGSTSMGTSTTDSSGVATKTYNSQGVGDVSFTAVVGTISSETYDIVDAKYYADNAKINNYMESYSGHQCAFIPYTVQYGDEVSFKFNTKPTHCLIGIGTSSSSSLVMEFNTNSTKLHRSYGTTSSYNVKWLDTYSKMGIHMINLSSSEDKAEIYRDDVYVDYWRCQLRTNNNALRVEKFNNDDYNVEIIIL